MEQISIAHRRRWSYRRIHRTGLVARGKGGKSIAARIAMQARTDIRYSRQHGIYRGTLIYVNTVHIAVYSKGYVLVIGVVDSRAVSCDRLSRNGNAVGGQDAVRNKASAVQHGFGKYQDRLVILTIHIAILQMLQHQHRSNAIQ